MSDKLDLFLYLLNQSHPVRRSQIIKDLEMNWRTASRYLADLESRGLIKVYKAHHNDDASAEIQWDRLSTIINKTVKE